VDLEEGERKRKYLNKNLYAIIVYKTLNQALHSLRELLKG